MAAPLENPKGKAQDLTALLSGVEKLRIEKDLFPEYHEAGEVWSKIFLLGKKLRKASGKELTDTKFKLRTLRIELERQEELQFERIRELKEKLREVHAAIQANVHNYDKFAAIIASGGPPPPLSKHYDWENYDEDEEDDHGSNNPVDEKVNEEHWNGATPEQNASLDELHERFNYEFVIYGKNECSMSDFAMHNPLEKVSTEGVCLWVGSTKIGVLFNRYRPLTELKASETQLEHYMSQTVIRKLEHDQKASLEQLSTREAQKLGEGGHLPEATDTKSTGAELRHDRPSSIAVSATPRNAVEPNTVNGTSQANVVRLSNGRSRKHSKASTYFPKGDYEKPEYLCNVCYRGVCEPVCKNRLVPHPLAIKVDKRLYSKPSVALKASVASSNNGAVHNTKADTVATPAKQAASSNLDLTGNPSNKQCISEYGSGKEWPGLLTSSRLHANVQNTEADFPAIRKTPNNESRVNGPRPRNSTPPNLKDIAQKSQINTTSPPKHMPLRSRITTPLQAQVVAPADGNTQKACVIDLPKVCGDEGFLCRRFLCPQCNFGVKISAAETPVTIAATQELATPKQNKGTRDQTFYCYHCSDFGHVDEYCWVRCPNLRPSCDYCDGTHLSSNCWTTYPEKSKEFFTKRGSHNK